MTANLRCGGCFKKIEGTYVTALSEHWHDACFVCTHCKKPFRDGKFSTFKNQAYCKPCHSYICPTCSKVIEDAFIEVEGQKIHPTCLKCSICRTVVGAKHEVLKAKIYCSDCAALERKASSHYSAPLKHEGVCKGCGKEILVDPFEAEGAKWHRYCFMCEYCNGMADLGWTKLNGKICCNKCKEYVCGVCNNVINDSFITLEGKKIHSACFVCSWCSSKLDIKSFVKVQDRQCCDSCAKKMKDAAANP